MRLIDKICPFNFSLDKDLSIIELGTSFRKIYPNATLGQSFCSMFIIERPVISTVSFVKLTACGSILFMLRCQQGVGPDLYGQFIEEDGHLIFAGNPRVLSTSDVDKLGLTFNDFAVHDSINDFLIVLQTQQTSMADLRSLTNKLKRKERILNQAKDNAEQASQAKTRFLSNMSHELRTPLNGILGVFNILKKKIEATPLVRLVDLGIESGYALTEIINDVLDIGKIEANEFSISLQEIDLKNLIGTTVEVLNIIAIKKDIAVELSYADDLSPDIVTDPLRYRQILNNLVNNAIKFSPNNTTVKIWVYQEAGFLCTQVTDQGIGIPAEKLELIFEPFKQADDSTTRRYGGTGLGLALVRQLSELLGGSVTVVSTVGIGSEFTFCVNIN